MNIDNILIVTIIVVLVVLHNIKMQNYEICFVNAHYRNYKI